MTGSWTNTSEVLVNVKFLYAPIPSCFLWEMSVRVAEVPVWYVWVHLCHCTYLWNFTDQVIFLEVIVVYEEAMPIPTNRY